VFARYRRPHRAAVHFRDGELKPLARIEETTAAQETANAAPKTAKGAPKTAKAAKAAGTKGGASVPREFSKKAIVLELLRRKEGATPGEIAKATDWQNHSIQDFMSGTIVKKMGLTVESAKNDAGERVYKVK